MAGWQTFLLMRGCNSRLMFLSQIACHRAWSPLPNLLPSLLPKLPNLMPNPQPRVQPAVKVAAKPAAGEPIPVACVEHVQLAKVKYVRQQKWHTVPVSQWTGAHIWTNIFLVFLWTIRPHVCMCCFISRIPCPPPPPHPGGIPSVWVCLQRRGFLTVAGSWVFLKGAGGRKHSHTHQETLHAVFRKSGNTKGFFGRYRSENNQALASLACYWCCPPAGRHTLDKHRALAGPIAATHTPFALTLRPAQTHSTPKTNSTPSQHDASFFP